MVEKGIVLYCVGCEPNILRYKDFFMGLAYITGGQYVPLSRAQGLSQVRNCNTVRGAMSCMTTICELQMDI